MDVMKSKEGHIVVSIILGFGLATLFRKVCKDKSCIVIKGPKLSEVQGHVYRIDDQCFKYKPVVVQCRGNEVSDSAIA
jgi:hypothetical protein